MATLSVPAPLHAKLGEPASEGLSAMFLDAHRIAGETCEHRVGDAVAALRLDISNLKFELVKWCFLFWIGQMAATAGVIGLLLASR